MRGKFILHRPEASLRLLMSKHTNARQNSNVVLTFPRIRNLPCVPISTRAQYRFQNKTSNQTSMFVTVPSAKIVLSLGRSTYRVFKIASALWHRSWVKSKSRGRPEMLKREFEQILKSRASVEPQNANMADPSSMPRDLDRNPTISR